MTDPVADSEDWEAESNPENNFSLCAFQIQPDRRPKTAFLRYVRITHCTDAAIHARNRIVWACRATTLIVGTVHNCPRHSHQLIEHL